MNKYYTTEEENKKNHKEYLASKYEILNNSKLDRLYEIAWDFGHSGGYGEIELYFSDMVDLIK